MIMPKLLFRVGGASLWSLGIQGKQFLPRIPTNIEGGFMLHLWGFQIIVSWATTANVARKHAAK